MASFHESVEFTSPSALSDDLRDDAFRCCTFDGLDVEGPGFEGIGGGCTFKNSAWYWSLFVMAQFIDVEFRECVFRGCSFADCVFARCKFVNCRFVRQASSAKVVAQAFPCGRLVKGFNYLVAAILDQDPAVHGGRRVVFLASDDDGASAEIGKLAEKLGFAPIKLGGLSEGGLLVQARRNSWGQLIFKDLVKFD